MAAFLASFALLPGDPNIFATWQLLVEGTNTMGRQNHDARLMAAAIVGDSTHLLTFNTSDFTRYAGLSSVIPVDPVGV